MAHISGVWQRWLPASQPAPEPIGVAVANARSLVAIAAAAGRPIGNAILQPILDAGTAVAAGPVPPATEEAFYAAYAALAEATADLSKRPRGTREYPFEDAVEDAVAQVVSHRQ